MERQPKSTDYPANEVRLPPLGWLRPVATLFGVLAAGIILWLTSRANSASDRGYWVIVAGLAAAGFIVAFSQIVGNWHRAGRPRLHLGVFFLAFLPTFLFSWWAVAAAAPPGNWWNDHGNQWAANLHLETLIHHLGQFYQVIAFGLGLLLGLSFTAYERISGALVEASEATPFIAEPALVEPEAVAPPASSAPVADEPEPMGERVRELVVAEPADAVIVREPLEPADVPRSELTREPVHSA